MNHTDVKMRIRQFVNTNFSLTGRQLALADSESLFASGIVDSLGVLDLVTFIENEFSIAVTDEDLLAENFETIERMVTFVCTKEINQVMVA
jgi:acyl carrier protein